MEGDNNKAPQGEPSVQPDFATQVSDMLAQSASQSSTEQQPAAQTSQPAQTVQSSIDPNKPQVRRERKWHRFAIPILSIAAVAIVGLIIYLALDVTGVIDTITGANTSEEEEEETPETVYRFETDRMSAQVDAVIESGDFESDEALAVQAELENYLENVGAVDSYEKSLGATALARFYLAQEGREGEGVELLEKIVAADTSSEEAKIYSLLELYRYHLSIESEAEQYEDLRRIMEFPDDVPMSYDSYPDLAAGLWDTYMELTEKCNKGCAAQNTTQEDHDHEN